MFKEVWGRNSIEKAGVVMYVRDSLVNGLVITHGVLENSHLE